MLDQILVPRAYSLAQTFGLDPNEVDPSIETMGYEIPDPSTFTDPQMQETAAFLRAAVPAIDPLYKHRRAIISDIYYWSNAGDDALLLWGPTGSGKTSAWEQWCACLGIPLFSIKGHKAFNEWEATGKTDLVDGNTVHTPGPLTLAAQYGLPVIINEYDRIAPAKAIVFNDIFEGRPFPVPSNNNMLVEPQPGFRVVLTANTNLVEDPSGNYGTASSHDISLLERLYSVHVGYPDRDVERALIEDVMSGVGDDLLAYWFDQEGFKVSTPNGLKEGAAITRAEYIDALLDVAHKIRAQSKDGGSTSDAALERTMSTRILRKWAMHAPAHARAPEKFGMSGLHLTLKKYLSNLATQSTSIALHQAVETVFGVGMVLKD
ncbi:MAG: AAA family ATPase [Sulfuritalea sp.]|nr:AAA family ATPase [Sulfuritalea sp.]